MRNLLASILFTAACSSAYADRIAIASHPTPRIAIAEAPARIRAPYGVEITRGNGETLPTYVANGRYYVEGTAGERYAVRISNPTGRRVEAVVTVDGLDAIDGEAGGLRKRGYIIPPYGDVRIEGFRTSLSDVATFRFSSVDGSYAGQKGKARNVGVIAVALFEERIADYRIAVPERRQRFDSPPWGRSAEPSGKPEAQKAAPSAADSEAAGRSSSRHDRSYDEAPSPAPTYRPGLGTEFGESRYSGASYTQFVRASNSPVAIAELRYNDAAGLIALGIPVYNPPYPYYSNDIRLRETADPFPGDHFARPPGR